MSTEKLVEILKNKVNLDNDRKVLEYYNNQMLNDIIPALEIFEKEADEYAKKRDDYNEKINHIPIVLIKILEKLYDAKFVMMSSFNAKLNLIDESDIDIGMLVKNLDKDKLLNIHKQLSEYGFKYTITCNPHRPDVYHCYVIVIDNVTIELKVRDIDGVSFILKIHDRLNNFTSKERSLLTYAKFILKDDKKSYDQLKRVIYAYASFSVEDAYLLKIERVDVLFKPV